MLTSILSLNSRQGRSIASKRLPIASSFATALMADYSKRSRTRYDWQTARWLFARLSRKTETRMPGRKKHTALVTPAPNVTSITPKCHRALSVSTVPLEPAKTAKASAQQSHSIPKWSSATERSPSMKEPSPRGTASARRHSESKLNCLRPSLIRLAVPLTPPCPNLTRRNGTPSCTPWTKKRRACWRCSSANSRRQLMMIAWTSLKK